MEESKLFKSIWRFNSIVIATAGILISLALLSNIYFLFRRQRINSTEIVNVDPNVKTKETFDLGKTDRVNGSKFVLAPLYSQQAIDLGYADKSSLSMRNILFVNMTDGTNRWLLQKNDQLILRYELLSKEDKTTVLILYHVVKTDTNKDGRLTENDGITIALSNLEGSVYREISPGESRFLGYQLLDTKTVALMYSTKGQGYISYVQLPELIQTKKVALTKIKAG